MGGCEGWMRGGLTRREASWQGQVAAAGEMQYDGLRCDAIRDGMTGAAAHSRETAAVGALEKGGDGTVAACSLVSLVVLTAVGHPKPSPIKVAGGRWDGQSAP